MKVLQIITSLRLGGAETLLSQLAPLMKKEGTEVRVLSLTSTMPLAAALRRHAIDVRSLHCDATIYQVGSLRRAARDIAAEIDGYRPNIIHSHLYLADLLTRVAAPRAARLITTLHNIDQWWMQKDRFLSLAKTWVDSWTAGLRNTRAIAVSESVASAALSALKLPPQRCKVIRNGIDVERFALTRRSLSSEPIIIQVGRFFPQKGHETTLQAFAQLLRKQPKIRLQLVGDGPRENDLRKLAAALNISERVEFLGPREDVVELLRQAHVFWMPSRWEGFGLACLEAMATGLPVIGSNVGAIPTLLADGAGHIIAPDKPEQLAQLTNAILNNYDAALAMGRTASQRVTDNYTIQETARGYLDCYAQMLDNAW